MGVPGDCDARIPRRVIAFRHRGPEVAPWMSVPGEGSCSAFDRFLGHSLRSGIKEQGPQRVDLTRSPSRPRMTGVCAFPPSATLALGPDIRRVGGFPTPDAEAPLLTGLPSPRPLAQAPRQRSSPSPMRSALANALGPIRRRFNLAGRGERAIHKQSWADQRDSGAYTVRSDSKAEH